MKFETADIGVMLTRCEIILQHYTSWPYCVCTSRIETWCRSFAFNARGRCRTAPARAIEMRCSAGLNRSASGRPMSPTPNPRVGSHWHFAARIITVSTAPGCRATMKKASEQMLANSGERWERARRRLSMVMVCILDIGAW